MNLPERSIHLVGASPRELQVFGTGTATPARIRSVDGGVAQLARLLATARPEAVGAVIKVSGVGRSASTGTPDAVTTFSRRPKTAGSGRWSVREVLRGAASARAIPAKVVPQADLLVLDPGGIEAAGPTIPSSGAVLACLPGRDRGDALRDLLCTEVWGRISANAAATAAVDADALRALDLVVGKGLSWERTALELVRALQTSPSLTALCGCRNLVVRFDLEGALHVVLEGGKVVDARLFFDPALREGGWRLGRDWPGDVPGVDACFVAGLALRIASDGAPTPGAIAAGIQTGLAAARALVTAGYGAPDGATGKDGLPYDAVGAALNGTLPPMPVATLPIGDGEGGPVSAGQIDGWSILTDSRAVAADAGGPLLAMGQRLAEFGLSGLFDVPREQIGKFVTVDRAEIESIRAIVHLVEVHHRGDRGDRPLSLGVFGPPGAGKSFAVKQIAKRLLDAEPLEFNLSQFDGPRDLVGALHQVREAVLASPGTTPLVFWDEFDSKAYGWLQLLLAPMQDGRFQDGQQSYSVGKCIFVFAGGTARSLARFGVFNGADREAQERAFRLAKGPDFKSRLHGALDVVGPNPRECWVQVAAREGRWQPDPSDMAYPLRRGLLLRGQLGLGPDEHLVMERGLLGALLELPAYEHGSRSFERVVYHLRHAARDGVYRRSDLPAPTLLAGHADGDELIQLAARPVPLVRILHELAQACHGAYLAHAEQPHYRESFEKLPAAVRADNYAAAGRIARVLEQAGLVIAAKGSPAELPAEAVVRRIEEQLERLAEAEHDGWRAFKEACGWRQGRRTRDRELLELQHDQLVPYAALTEKEKDKDRNAVRNYPRILALAGCALGEGSGRG